MHKCEVTQPFNTDKQLSEEPIKAARGGFLGGVRTSPKLQRPVELSSIKVFQHFSQGVQ